MKKPTRRKIAWAGGLKSEMLSGTPLSPSAGTEIRYYAKLEDPIQKMTFEVEHAIRAFFKRGVAQQFFAEDASVSSQARILANKLAEKFNDLFADLAKPTAESMVSSVNKDSTIATHSSLKALSGGLTLPTTVLTGELSEVLAATVNANVSLIKSISSQYLSGVSDAFMRSITTGNGLQDLIPYLHSHKGITLRRARMIARDQTRKTFNNISKHRMQGVGIEKYTWLHTGGSDHPRKEHQAMSGNIYRFDDPPVIDSKTGERGIPGQLINCRCKMIPVIKFDEDDE